MASSVFLTLLSGRTITGTTTGTPVAVPANAVLAFGVYSCGAISGSATALTPSFEHAYYDATTQDFSTFYPLQSYGSQTTTNFLTQPLTIGSGQGLLPYIRFKATSTAGNSFSASVMAGLLFEVRR